MFGYLSYIIAEMVELSGIMTIFCCGLIIDKYSKQHLSEKAKTGTELSFKVIAHQAEAFTFLYLGLSVFSLGDNWSVIFMISMAIAMMIARAASIFISTLLIYLVQCCKFGLDSRTT